MSLKVKLCISIVYSEKNDSVKLGPSNSWVVSSFVQLIIHPWTEEWMFLDLCFSTQVSD